MKKIFLKQILNIRLKMVFEENCKILQIFHVFSVFGVCLQCSAHICCKMGLLSTSQDYRPHRRVKNYNI